MTSQQSSSAPLRKLKATELAAWRAQQISEQDGKCPISGWFIGVDKAAADHCHKTGMMRSTLANWVNSNLGRIENAATRIGGGVHVPTFLRACAAYIEFWDENPSNVFHPSHKSPEEKAEAARIKRNAAARKKRAAAKAAVQQ
ncbi:endonuclease domain-containing protein [Robbsia andropogonis]|uniref:endonuclease domain-containing protein n=1 Tax=Robbsia andropogonis TaxID=28092 RepID=UPI002A6A94BB|nr:endonuclease domain-containing protein [Robbsia andropogonis]